MKPRLPVFRLAAPRIILLALTNPGTFAASAVERIKSEKSARYKLASFTMLESMIDSADSLVASG